MNNIYRKNLTQEVQDVYTENYKTYCNKFYKIYINRKKSFVNGLEDLSLRCQHSPNWYTDSLKFYQTPGAFFAGKNRLILKFITKCQELQIAKNSLEIQIRLEDSHSLFWNLLQSSSNQDNVVLAQARSKKLNWELRINPVIYGQLIFDKRSKVFNVDMYNFKQIILEKVDVTPINLII